MPGMISLVLLLLVQAPDERRILEAEDARSADPSALVRALQSDNPRLQRLAVRAIGRLERPSLASAVSPLLGSGDPEIRTEVVQALGQMGVMPDWVSLLRSEKDFGVRAAIYVTIGRVAPASPEIEKALAAGLAETDPVARTGAAHGLEALLRLNAKTLQPSAATVDALRKLVRGLRPPNSQTPKTPPLAAELALLALNAAGDNDAETIAVAAEDANPQVRRLAVMVSRQWKEDSSALVRVEALRVAGNCERALRALVDSSEHVVLTAIDLMGTQKCDPVSLERILDSDRSWRRQGHAIVALARVRPEAIRSRMPKLIASPVWQLRAWAARAAVIAKDEVSRKRLLADKEPNVVAEAIASPEDGVAALRSNHYGLVLTAARAMKSWPRVATAVPVLLETLERITAERKATSRDPRLEILDRLREANDRQSLERIRKLVADPEPAVAKRAAEVASAISGSPVPPVTLRYETEPLPPAEFIQKLRGATARIRMREAGSFTIALLADDAPATVATFARLAEQRYYDGLTFHRIVPNFVIQGGSPGANEYVGIGPYMRDEVGMRSHLRGTLGISTRGRDTGDAQIFVNLVDNFRLDHGYTVFAEVIEGMSSVDRIQEGDVIESVEVRLLR